VIAVPGARGTIEIGVKDTWASIGPKKDQRVCNGDEEWSDYSLRK
jgi:hypothetical protein